MLLNLFIGCVSKEDVKTRYRELAKKLHPDRGGKEEEFKKMLAEYEYINGNVLTYPLTNIRNAGNPFGRSYNNPFTYSESEAEDMFKGFEAFQDSIRRAAQRAKQEQQKQQAQDKWSSYKRRDVNYKLIEDLINQAQMQDRSAKWVLMEIYKLDDLDINHFKFAHEVLIKKSTGERKLAESWINDSYRNYVIIQAMEWRLK